MENLISRNDEQQEATAVWDGHRWDDDCEFLSQPGQKSPDCSSCRGVMSATRRIEKKNKINELTWRKSPPIFRTVANKTLPPVAAARREKSQRAKVEESFPSANWRSWITLPIISWSSCIINALNLDTDSSLHDSKTGQIKPTSKQTT